MTPQELRDREAIYTDTEKETTKKESPCRDWKCELKNLVIEMRHKEYRESIILSIVVEAFNNA